MKRLAAFLDRLSEALTDWLDDLVLRLNREANGPCPSSFSVFTDIEDLCHSYEGHGTTHWNDHAKWQDLDFDLGDLPHSTVS